jgi:uncharacterized delta-60 repeat protein
LIASATLLASAGFAACSDDANNTDPDGGNKQDASTTVDSSTGTDSGGGNDSGTQDTGTQDTGTQDSGGDAGAAPAVLPIASGRHARLFNVTFDPQGNIYAVGQLGDNLDPNDMTTLLVKVLPNGTLDPNFGTNGVVHVNVTAAGSAEAARGVVVQQGGKIVVAGVAERTTTASDPARDIYTVRFNTTGTIDRAYGSNGIRRYPLGDGTGVQQGGLTLLANEDMIVVGSRRAAVQPPPPDAGTAPIWNELAVFKIKGADGAIDTTFANVADSGTHDGIYSVGFGSSLNPKTATLGPNGTLFVSGYTNKGGNKPIVVKLSAAGIPDNTFGVNGVYFPESGIDGLGAGGTAEAYTALLQGDKIVTVGYGRENSNQPAVGWIFIRLTAAGTVDNTFGTAGHVFIGLNDQGANARNGLLLSDNRIVGVGGSSPPKPQADAGTQAQYATVGLLGTNGAPDTTFGPSGLRQYNLGGPATGRAGHVFWGAALSPDKKQMAIVGIKGAVNAVPDAGVAAGEDEGVFLLLPTGN